MSTQPLVGYAVTRSLPASRGTSAATTWSPPACSACSQAARSYDAERGVDFAAFARVRIRGALLDELRSRDWASRSVRGLRATADATASG